MIFDDPSKALAPPEAERLAAIHQAAGREKFWQRRGSPQVRPFGQGACNEVESAADAAADDDARRKANEAKRQAYFEKTGVWLWPELTDKQQAEGLAKQKSLLHKVADKFSSLHMRLYETQYFLFLTDLPPQWVPVYTSCLDAMHNQLCTAYGIKDKDRVWIGKLPVVAFADRESFEEFEKTFFGKRSTER